MLSFTPQASNGCSVGDTKEMFSDVYAANLFSNSVLSLALYVQLCEVFNSESLSNIDVVGDADDTVGEIDDDGVDDDNGDDDVVVG